MPADCHNLSQIAALINVVSDTVSLLQLMDKVSEADSMWLLTCHLHYFYSSQKKNPEDQKQYAFI